MKKYLLGLALIGSALAVPAYAALQSGAKAPDFKAEAALAGKQFTYKLADALKKGPVVVYFYPKANSGGCDIEAHEFSEATDEFASYGASIIGVSTDDIQTLKTYSANEKTCAGKLAVASDTSGEIMKAYDAVGSANPANAAFASALNGKADRTSYVVAPDNTVLYSFSDIKAATDHVKNTLAAVKDWSEKQKKTN